MSQIRLLSAAKRDEKIKLEDNIPKYHWSVFYGVAPNTKPVMQRASFTLIQTIPVPTERMLTGTSEKFLADVVEYLGRGQENKIVAQRYIEVEFDASYIGHYLLTLLRKLDIVPQVPIDKLSEFNPDNSLKDIEKMFGTKQIVGVWDTLRQLFIKAAVERQQWETLTVDMDAVEVFIEQMGWQGDKAESVRVKARTDPAGFAALKQKVKALIDLEVE